MSRPCELAFALDLSLIYFHLVAVGLAILCSQRWILVNLNAFHDSLIFTCGFAWFVVLCTVICRKILASNIISKYYAATWLRGYGCEM